MPPSPTAERVGQQCGRNPHLRYRVELKRTKNSRSARRKNGLDLVRDPHERRIHRYPPMAAFER